uniref:Uncharacterized protein n=1 Tax=Piliocolobus tephrosceles TaxID=591936 RepID=A0A8C9III3_9PRIM
PLESSVHSEREGTPHPLQGRRWGAGLDTGSPFLRRSKFLTELLRLLPTLHGCSPPGCRGPHWGHTLPKPSAVSEAEGECGCWARHREPRTEHFSQACWWHLHFQWHFHRSWGDQTPILPGAEELLIKGLSVLNPEGPANQDPLPSPALQPGLVTVLQRQR